MFHCFTIATDHGSRWVTRAAARRRSDEDFADRCEGLERPLRGLAGKGSMKE